jgi:hypothetical protein
MMTPPTSCPALFDCQPRQGMLFERDETYPDGIEYTPILIGSAVWRYRIVSAFRAEAAKKTIPATKTSISNDENERKLLNRYQGKSGSFALVKSYTKAPRKTTSPRMRGANVPAAVHLDFL